MYHILSYYQRWGRAGARFILPINWEQPPPRCDGYLTISRPVLHLSIQQSIHTSWLYPSTKDNWKILWPKTLNLCISQNRLAFECFLFAFWAGSILLKEGPQMFFRQVHMKDIHCVHFLVTYSVQQHSSLTIAWQFWKDRSSITGDMQHKCYRKYKVQAQMRRGI